MECTNEWFKEIKCVFKPIKWSIKGKEFLHIMFWVMMDLIVVVNNMDLEEVQSKVNPAYNHRN